MYAPIVQRVAVGATTTPWVILNRLQNPFTVGLQITLANGAVLTGGKVQYSLDNPNAFYNKKQLGELGASLTRAAAVATMNEPGHPLKTGDSVYIEGAGIPFEGGPYDVTVSDANNYTFAVANTGLTVAANSTRRGFIRTFDHATLTGLSAAAANVLAVPACAVRFTCTSVATNYVEFLILQGLGTDS